VLLYRAILYLVAKPSHVGADVDGLSCSVHRPMTNSSQRGGLHSLTGVVLSRHLAVGGGPFLGLQSPRI
jgi:hypothetical protein